MNAEKAQATKDDVIKDLSDMVTKHIGPGALTIPFMSELTRYMAHRDHRIWEHAYRLGENNGRKQHTG